MYLFMDDYRPCPPGFKLARDADECLLLLHEYPISILSLDYDLGPGQPTGKDVAAVIASKQLYPREIYLHSSSPQGRRAMYELLYANKPEGVTVHNGPIPEARMQEIISESKR
ncbi:cyclic-phosphate processing receiver domain-containing protein [Paenibacillus sp. CMAA1739]|uniref:cyclic-phosphate processing receiver domain-containing protein n=1 Tax=Paenibacillus ottowii TaxID=2315729 RepID=UPI0027312206|nr:MULTISPECIES: cyclic-phosphate processing receiver domain-containing protein [Paenibacillus]MDP1513021.1 cell division protein FtsJ [Paenibacillus ottowii]MEC4568993.1 cyclic-phosphate processing receiver domain-containing protein [Paenibacillus sp. CMAA1739]